MVESGSKDVETFASCRHNTVAQYIATMPIIDLCLEEERRLGTRVFKRWWEQEGLNLVGMCTVDQEVKREEREGGTDGAET